ncbi:hypothetical protein A2U01_0044904, partial [Trifolium medium]|nr:hypothetical protein [Trifolium medium]
WRVKLSSSDSICVVPETYEVRDGGARPYNASNGVIPMGE